MFPQRGAHTIGQQLNKSEPQSRPSQPPTRSYEYKHLEDPVNQIRLLHLNPNHQSGTVRCNIGAHLLKDNTPFVALSYEWEKHKSESEVEILVDEQSLFVPHNLWLFLDHLRSRRINSSFSNHHLIWVDAICIDQDDLEEKTSQVKLMNQIFGQADQVLAWCKSSPTFDAGQTFSFVRAFTFNLRSEGSFQTARSIGLVPDEHGRAVYNHITATDGWRLVYEFCQLSYWSRRWIVQEVAFAKNLIFLCNGEELKYDALKRVLSFAHAHATLPIGQNAEQYRGIHPNWWKMVEALQATVPWRVFRLRSRIRTLETLPSLERLMTTFADTDCSILHDRVFALINLAQERNSLPVEYSSTLFQLFETVIRNMQMSSDLDWPRQLMKILRLHKNKGPLPRPSHSPTVPIFITAQDLLCISHVFDSSSKDYLRDLTKAGQKLQDELGTKERFRRHYRINEFKLQNIKWNGNFLLRASTPQLSEIQRWSNIVSSWRGSAVEKILTIVRNIEDFCPTRISGARLVVLNNGGLAYVAGEPASGDILVRLPKTTFAILFRPIEDGMMAVGAIALGPKSGRGWADLIRNWYVGGDKSPPEKYLRHEKMMRDDGTMMLFLDAAIFVNLFRSAHNRTV